MLLAFGHDAEVTVPFSPEKGFDIGLMNFARYPVQVNTHDPAEFQQLFL
jgi:hypothetical protein